MTDSRLKEVADLRHDTVITRWDDPLTTGLLSEAAVLLTGWGDEVWERGIAVSSAAQANALPVAEYTVATIILARKRAFRLAAGYRAGRPTIPGDGEDVGNNDVTVGMVGASRVGRLVLTALRNHDMKLLVADPTLDQASAATLGARLVDLDTLCARSDIVTLHAPALSQTRHLLDDRRLGLIRPGGIVVNTARGSLVDTDALTRHCATGRLDAVLDVTEPEPLPDGHPLLGMPNVFITPHLAGALGNEVRRLGSFAVADVERHLRGEPMHGAIAHHDLERIA